MFRLVLRIFIYGLAFSIAYIFFCKWINPPFTITQLAAIVENKGIERDYISYHEMGTNAKLAVIAGEDQLFPGHNGFDFKNIKKAIQESKKKNRLRGASTISQQTAKNVFLWQHGGWVRKGLEAYFTFMIETLWSKQRILEVYLNVAEMGKGIYGIEAASQAYFHKPANKLTQAEAAKIASCLPNPKLFTVKPMSKRVASRFPWIVGQMNVLKQDPDIQAVLK